MSKTTEDWFRCELDRKIQKQLSKRTDRHGLIHFGCFFAVLVALGATLAATWNSWWAVPVFVFYSVAWSFGNAAGHEACHGTPFRTYWLNQALLYVCSWMENWEPITVKWIHARHHTYTSNVENDAEYLVPNAVQWKDLAGLLTGWNQVWHYNKELLQLSWGYANHFIKVSVPESELPKVFRNARIYLASYLLVIGVAVYMQSWLPVCLLILPRVVGAPMHGILRITQHGALATEVRDHRQSTRTMTVNPVLGFFYCNMNYHIEHHMFPMVPFHALAALHQQVRDQMPKPSRGVPGAMAEIFTTMRAQRVNPGQVWDANNGQLTS
jgi:fatty acid desaturase